MMSETIDIKGIDKAELLAALFNASHPQGLGLLKFDPKPATKEDARIWIEMYGLENKFDYIQGRVLKVIIGGDTLNTWGYDRDNGRGAAERVVNSLRSKP